MRRFATVLALCSLPALVSSARADVPAELLAPSPAAAAQTPAAPGSAGPAIFDEAAVLLLTKKDFERLSKASADQRKQDVAMFWNEYAPHFQACLEYGATHFREGGSVVTQRMAALIALRAPVKIYDETRDWTGTSAPVFASPGDLLAFLRPAADAAPAAPAMTPLSGSMPTQAWVYPGETVNDQRVVWFVDEGADGTWRFVKDEKKVPVTTVISTGTVTEMPPELFPAVGLGEKIEPLPTLTQDAMPLVVTADSFKASAGRTFVRFMAQIDPQDVDLELSLDPAAYKAGATFWLQVEKDGKPVHQAKLALAELAASEPWLAEVGLPLAPGVYQVTALVGDKDGKGGKKTRDVEVPALTGPVALSSVVIAKADPAAGEAGLPKAVPAADGALAPFQIGNYTVRPQVPPVFKRGDTIALVVQVYSSTKATVEYDLYREGSYQNSLEPIPITGDSVTDIQQFLVTADYTDGAYEFHILAKGAGTEVKRTVSFRIKG